MIAPLCSSSVIFSLIISTFSSSSFAQAVEDKALDQVLVTATRTPQKASDVLSDNVVISAEDIALSGQTSLVELLQKQRGIEITANGGPGTSASVFMRGAANNQNIVLIDGVRVGSSTTGGATWSSIPLSQIDHIEIVYGPLSSLYGADAIGGVIQIFTKKGSGAPRLTASAGVGSYGTRTMDASVSGATEGDHRFSYAIAAAHENADGFSATKPDPSPYSSYNPDKDGYKKDSSSGQFSLELAKGQEVGFNFLQSRLNAQYDNGPGFDTRVVQDLQNLAVYSKNEILPWWSSKVQLSQTTDKSVYISSDQPDGTSDITTKQNNFSWQNDLLIGPDVLQLLAERREEEVSATGLSGDRTTNSLAASYQLKRGDHLATASIRNDNSSQFGTHATGSLGYGYRLNKDWRANVSYGTSFRAPTFNELYYPGYGITANKPEKGKNAEVGLVYDDGTSQLNVSYYHNKLTDLIVSTTTCPVQPDSHPYGCAYNVDKATLEGVSLGGSTKLGDFALRGSLDVQNPRDDTTGKLLARRARQHGTAALEYAAGAVKAGVEMVVSGRRYDDVDNQVVLGGYSLVNLYASYDLTEKWSLFGRWNNVLNKDYELARYYGTGGASLFVGVRYGFR
ncbi:TonB-dependent receptor [Glaciimonas sp. PAMC28666]|nr:TonB-dependent receptor [Glaciimonas sp. PAMC28666]